jgi:DNA-binding MarR family transcriptional regulator
MNDVKEPGPDHIMALLGYLMDGLRRDVLAAIRTAAGERSVPPVLHDLRFSHIRMLGLTPPDGMRVSDLADRIGMSKQALGEFATALEGLGLMESVRDPADRRVRIVRPTALGLEVVDAGATLIGEVEAAWRERVGARDWDRLRALLAIATSRGPVDNS